MNQGKYIFSQLTEFLPRRVFDRIVKEHNGNKYVRSFTCWNQMLCMVFGQLTSRDSMRDLYALDSTTIDLCLSVFWWAEFRKAKGGIKLHTLYDVKTSVPSFLLISKASLHDVNVLDVIAYEAGSFYVMAKRISTLNGCTRSTSKRPFSSRGSMRT